MLLVACTALCATVSAQSSKKMPHLILKDIRGRRIRLDDYRGKVVLINFWATWCPPCRTEIPELIKMQKEYRERGLRVLGITFPPQTTTQVGRFVRKLRFNYPVALGTKQTKALFDQSEVLPITVIIDRAGKVRDVVRGILYPEEFEEKIKPLLVEREERLDTAGPNFQALPWDRGRPARNWSTTLNLEVKKLAAAALMRAGRPRSQGRA